MKTWKHLAKKKIWVNGTADGLGEDLDPNISSLVKYPWIKLTQAKTPSIMYETINKTLKWFKVHWQRGGLTGSAHTDRLYVAPPTYQHLCGQLHHRRTCRAVEYHLCPVPGRM